MPPTQALSVNREALTFCKIHKDIKAGFFCLDKNCKFNVEQPYYCDECMCPERHGHLPGKIPQLVN